eukprot:jgi/Bigna1/86948/estExt_fgenesh1_pg.C_150148
MRVDNVLLRMSRSPRELESCGSVDVRTARPERDELEFKRKRELGPRLPSDPELNFASARFNPDKALREDSIAIPVQDAPTRDHLSACRSLLPQTDDDYVPAKKPSAARANDKEPTLVNIEKKNKRNVTPVSEENSQRFSKNFLEPSPTACLAEEYRRMLFKEGAWGDELGVKKRARVLIRGVKRIKAKVTGYLRAFDKHCNMILFDVLETSTLRLAETPLKSRHMNQLFIRGENVVVVSMDPTASGNDENDQEKGGGSNGR